MGGGTAGWGDQPVCRPGTQLAERATGQRSVGAAVDRQVGSEVVRQGLLDSVWRVLLCRPGSFLGFSQTHLH